MEKVCKFQFPDEIFKIRKILLIALKRLKSYSKFEKSSEDQIKIRIGITGERENLKVV
jgi:hypothetical protein